MKFNLLMPIATVSVAAMAIPNPAMAAVPACTPGGSVAAAGGVTVRDLPEREGQLGILQVVGARGAHLRVYYDAASEAKARRAAACLGAQLALLQDDLGDDRTGAEWHSVVFTSDPDYVPPRTPGQQVVRFIARGGEEAGPEQMVLATMPHEQVHAFQRRAGAMLPRWFTEGHATWTGLRVTALLDPAAGAAERARVQAARAGATGPLALAAWGSVRPRREAIMRQVSPEDRARMEADPTFSPGGSYRFTSADLVGDESNMPARYASSLAVFDGLEARHGAAKVRAWARELTATAGPVRPPALAESVRRHFNEDLSVLLADPG